VVHRPGVGCRARASSSWGDGDEEEVLDLLPEPEEALRSYSREYRARQSIASSSTAAASPQAYGARVPRGERQAEALDSSPSVSASVITRGGREGRRKGPGGQGSGHGRGFGYLVIASVGGTVCALSLLASRGHHYTQRHRTLQLQQQKQTAMTLEHLHDEIAKGTDRLFGHRRHVEAPRSKLVSIQGYDRTELLRPGAAQAFLRMRSSARRDGINLHLVSGFRSIADQEALYFGIKASRMQSARERARVSAPPGYSEHHTGFALDICDDEARGGLDESFAERKAFEWLRENARAFNFELSFPLHNSDGVAFEPWHWRFEGETEAIQTFYRA